MGYRREQLVLHLQNQTNLIEKQVSELEDLMKRTPKASSKDPHQP
jgi:hypothetical protein